MAIKCLNPFNKNDASRLTSDTTLADADLLSFQKDSDGTNRKITWANFATNVASKILGVIIPTGLSAPWLSATEPTGWVFLDGGTIGSVASNATNRANADTEDLYALLWDNFTNTELIIQDSSGTPTTRGISAAADFAANKRLPLPDLRGRTFFGLDDMGGSAANRITTAGSGIDGATQGATGGAQNHTLTEAELPAHTHDTDVPTTTPTSASTGGDVSTPGATTPVTSTSVGSGDAHNNMPPTFIGWWITKL